MKKLKNYINKIPNWTYYVLGFYFISRMVLIPLGLNIQNGNSNIVPFKDFKYAGSSFLNSWTKWDAGFYTSIASSGYEQRSKKESAANYAFFPLYPILINLLNKIINNVYLSGWLISNTSLIIASFVLYKLAKIDFDERYSLRIVKYLYLLPMAFIFSAVLTEGLFILLLVLSIYFARKNKWVTAGVFGFFLSLSRPHGILILIPFLIEYLNSINYKLNKIKVMDLSVFIFPILGILSFCAYSYMVTNDPLAFIHAQSLWGKPMGNPIFFIVMNILQGARSNAIYASVILLLVFFSLNRIRFSYWLLSMTLLLVPLTMGVWSIPRYTVVIFPLAYILARMTSNKTIDFIFTILLTMFQLSLFIKWQAGSYFTM